MSKIKNIVVALGATFSLGLAAIPLATYADQAEDTLDINVSINDVISMTLTTYPIPSSATDDGKLTCDSRVGSSPEDCTGFSQVASTVLLPNSADTTTMYTEVRVSTNSPDGYNLTLADADGNAALQNNTGDSIATTATKPTAGTSSWAVCVDGSTLCDDSQATWLAMPTSTSGNTITVKNYAPNPKSGVTDDLSTVHYGVATSSEQATGSYSDIIIYTATTN